MMISVFSLCETVASFWVLTYFLPQAIIHAADLTNSSDCMICSRDAQTNAKLDLIALPLNLETLTKVRGYYGGATLTSAKEPYLISPGYVYIDIDKSVEATETGPGLAVSLGHVSSIAGKAHLCFEAEELVSYSHFVGLLNTGLHCNYTLFFNSSALTWDPVFDESEVNENSTYNVIMHSHDLTWGEETMYIEEEPVYFIKSSSQLLYLGIGLTTGTTFFWDDFSSLPQFNIMHLIFRNLFCNSPVHFRDQYNKFYLPLCSDAYFSDDIYRKFSEYQGFPNIYNHTWFKVKGFTTEVSLQGTGFFFLCGQSVYVQLPRFWHGSCTVVAIQPKDMEFMGSHTTHDSFLKAIPLSFADGDY